PSEPAAAIAANLARVVHASEETLRMVVLCLVAEGHLIIEDLPGVGKTTLAKALARSLDCSFSRLQFTPDLLPSDITGVNVFNQGSGTFEFRAGCDGRRRERARRRGEGDLRRGDAQPLRRRAAAADARRPAPLPRREPAVRDRAAARREGACSRRRARLPRPRRREGGRTGGA